MRKRLPCGVRETINKLHSLLVEANQRARLTRITIISRAIKVLGDQNPIVGPSISRQEKVKNRDSFHGGFIIINIRGHCMTGRMGQPRKTFQKLGKPAIGGTAFLVML